MRVSTSSTTSGFRARAGPAHVEVGVYGEFLGGDTQLQQGLRRGRGRPLVRRVDRPRRSRGLRPLRRDAPPVLRPELDGRLLAALRPGDREALRPVRAAPARGSRYRLSKLPSLIGSGVFVGATLEAGNVWHRTTDIKPSSLIWAGSLYGVADTILGPLYLGWGLAEQGNSSFFLSLGLPM